MCVTIYIAADHPLPLVPWHDSRRAFHVIALPDDEKDVRAHLSKPHVRYVGTEEGCGCPFNYGHQYPEMENEPDDLAGADRSRVALVAYLSINRVQELYSRSGGDLPEATNRRQAIEPQDILKPDFVFEEGVLYTIKHGSAEHTSVDDVVTRAAPKK